MATIDATMPIRSAMPIFPGDPAVQVEVERSLARGDPYSISILTLGTHTGTHVDPPSHFVVGGATLDEIDLEALNGACRLVTVAPGRSSVFEEDVRRVPEGTERVIFRTANSERWARGEGFFQDFVDLSPPAALALVRRGIRLVGIDSLSVESDPTMDYPVHHALLSNGTLILEGLCLSGAPEGEYRLRCLPIRIAQGDGGPCRALLDPV